MSELETEFENLGTVRAVPERYLRSQQDKAAQQALQNGGMAGDAVDGPGLVAAAHVDEGMSAYDLAEAVDILSKIPKDFYEKMVRSCALLVLPGASRSCVHVCLAFQEAKKWQERREALEAVEKLSDTIKLENGDYGELMRALLRVIAKDTNVMLVALSGKVISQIARGLRKKFSPFALQTIKTVLDKFKEKKTTVVAALRDAADAAFPAVSADVT